MDYSKEESEKVLFKVNLVWEKGAVWPSTEMLEQCPD